MDDSLQSGDLAIIIESVLGVSVGKIVQCIKIVGSHKDFGIIWEVRGQGDLITEYGAKGPKAHVPQKWLKKIKPGDLDKKQELEKLNKSTLVKELLKNV